MKTDYRPDLVNAGLTLEQRQQRMMSIFLAWIFGPAVLAWEFWLYVQQQKRQEPERYQGVRMVAHWACAAMCWAVILGWTGWVLWRGLLFMESHAAGASDENR